MNSFSDCVDWHSDSECDDVPQVFHQRSEVRGGDRRRQGDRSAGGHWSRGISQELKWKHFICESSVYGMSAQSVA